MKRIALLFLALTLATCVASAKDNDVRAAIENGNHQFSALVAKGDVAGIVNMYAADAKAFPPNADIANGHAEIQKVWQGFVDSGVGALDLSTDSVESHGDIAFESGKYVVKGKDGQPMDQGKYLVVWKRQGKNWQLYRDIWNTSQPAPAAK